MQQIVCIHTNEHMRTSVSRDSSIKEDVIYVPTSMKIDTHTHTLFYVKSMIFTVFMSSLDFWSTVDEY